MKGGAASWALLLMLAWLLGGCTGLHVVMRAGEADVVMGTGQRLVPQLAHGDRVTGLVVSSDGRLAVSAGADGLAKVWDLETGQLRATLRVSHGEFPLALSPDGRLLATGGARHFGGGAEGLGDLVALDLVRKTTYADDLLVRIWDLDEGSLRFEGQGHESPATALAYSPDGTRLVSGDGDGRVVAWDVEGGTVVGSTGVRNVPGFAHWLKGDKTGVVRVVVPSADRVVLVDTLARVVDLDGELDPLGESTELEGAMWSGELLGAWISDDGTAIIEDHKTRLERAARDGGARTRVELAGSRWFGSDLLGADRAGQQVVVSSSMEDGRVHARLIDLGTGGVLLDRVGQAGAASWLPDGRVVVAMEGGLEVWSPGAEVAAAQRVRTLVLPRPIDVDVAFAWKGQGVATVCGVWSLETGQLRPEVRPALGVSASADGSTLAWRRGQEGGVSTVEVVDAARGTRRSVVEVAANGRLTLSPDGSRLAAVVGDHVELFDTGTGKLAASLSSEGFAPSTAVFAPDGASVWVGGAPRDADTIATSRGLVVRFEAATGRRLGAMEELDHPLISLAVSQDGESVALGGARTVEVFAAASSARRWSSVDEHADLVTSLAFSPDGRELASGDRLGQVRLWEASTGALKGQEATTGTSLGVRLSYSPDGRVLAMANGTVRLRHRGEGSELTLMSFVGAGSCDGLAVTDGGLFSGTDGAFRHVAFRSSRSIRDSTLVTADQLFDRFYRADLLAAFAAGAAVDRVTPALPEAPAPTVRFAAATPETTTSPVLPVQVYVDGQGAEVEEVRLFVNGARVEPASVGVRGFRRAGEAYGSDVVLSPGTNLLEAEAYSAGGRVRSVRVAREVVLDVAPGKPRLFVLAVALNSYADPAQPLTYARADVDAAVKELESIGGIFASVEVRTLADEAATRQAVEDAVGEIARSARPEDVFVLYAAGHGTVVACGGEAPEYRLLTYKASLRSDATLCAEGVSERRLAELLRVVPARKKLLVLDTCQSGAAATERTLIAARGAVETDAIKRLGRAEGVAIVAAAKASEYAVEVPSLGHGLFTWVLLKGMEGGAAEEDGTVTVFGLFHYLQRELPKVSEEVYARPQYPITVLQGQDFPLGVRPR